MWVLQRANGITYGHLRWKFIVKNGKIYQTNPATTKYQSYWKARFHPLLYFFVLKSRVLRWFFFRFWWYSAGNFFLSFLCCCCYFDFFPPHSLQNPRSYTGLISIQSEALLCPSWTDNPHLAISILWSSEQTQSSLLQVKARNTVFVTRSIFNYSLLSSLFAEWFLRLQ